MLVSDFFRRCGNQKLKIRICKGGKPVFHSLQINISCLKYYPYYIQTIKYTNHTLIIYISDEKCIDGFGMEEDKIILPKNKITISNLLDVLNPDVKICPSIELLKNNNYISKISFEKDIIYIY